MYTIISIPLVEVRAEPSERSELETQILFGEQIEIIEKRDTWYQIRNLADNYTGWISKESITKKHFTEEAVDTSNFTPLTAGFTICFKTTHVEKIILTGGSLIPPIENDRFVLHDEIYQLAQYAPVLENNNKGQLVVELANQYMNTPYLWGGKNIFGIDCSGLVQIAYRMVGEQLARNASQQVNTGTVVNFLSEAKAGDLAFFENEEGNITHVGILMNSHQILHASGWVKTEIIDSQGIISSSTGKYTHKLRVIKRLV